MNGGKQLVAADRWPWRRSFSDAVRGADDPTFAVRRTWTRPSRGGAVVLLLSCWVATACSQRRGLEQTDGATAADGSSPGTGGLGGAGSSGSGGSGSGGSGSGGNGGPGSAGSSGSGGSPSGSGGRPSVDASVDGGRPPSLILMPPTNHDFASVEVGVATGAMTFTITNSGDQPTGPLMLSNDNPAAVMTSGCTGSLGGGASCTLSVVFKARSAGPDRGTLTMSATPGGTVAMTVTATGLYRLTITKTGTGTATSQPAGLSCGATCSALFPPGTVKLHATSGTDQLFGGWVGADCPAGLNRDCAVTLSGTTTVTASFSPLTNNLIFVTSATGPTNLGSSAAYDDRCNAAATAGGLNDDSGKAYVALIASSASDLPARLGSARGWVRLDGKPVFDTLGAALLLRQAFNAVLFDELGMSSRSSNFVTTGLSHDGTADQNCTGWTGSGSAAAGTSDSGANDWASSSTISCMGGARIYCLGKTKTKVVTPTVTSGKRIWISSAPFSIGGGQAPDGLCQAPLPSGVTAGAALISTTTRAAADVLAATTSYVRLDGTLVGTGAQIAAGTVESGIWQTADGAYLQTSDLAWTGSARPGVAGTTESTCASWTDASMSNQGAMRLGMPNSATRFWSVGTGGCGLHGFVYCVQTAP